MRELALKQQSVAEALQAELSQRWDPAVRYFRARGGVVFLSDMIFWGHHGFAQQSLARALVEAGVPVTWWDGIDWRFRRPIVETPHPLLRVRSLGSVPGRRFAPVDRWAQRRQARTLRECLESNGKKRVFWVQSGMPEAVAERMPYVDVYSVFDDPDRHSPTGHLCGQARLVFCQNQEALRRMSALGAKVQLAHPPIELPREAPASESLGLPKGFPDRVVGYVGSFGSWGYDLVQLEELVSRLPDVGFVLGGRTDLEGLVFVDRLRQFANFHYVPWMPRPQIVSLWRRMQVNLLLYRPLREQTGAFPCKILESTYYGASALVTAVPKTEGLEPFFPRTSDPAQMETALLGLLRDPGRGVESAYQHFAFAMNPRLHLIRAAEWLQRYEK